MVPILSPRVIWECSNCPERMATDSTPDKPILHPCAGLRGLLAPMIPEGTNAHIVAHERDDYIGSERVQLDGENRPIMSVTTTRDDGEDCIVYAPLASGTGEVN